MPSPPSLSQVKDTFLDRKALLPGPPYKDKLYDLAVPRRAKPNKTTNTAYGITVVHGLIPCGRAGINP